MEGTEVAEDIFGWIDAVRIHAGLPRNLQFTKEVLCDLCVLLLMIISA